ncbi:hypothetical protein MSIMFB_02750 [Mycobacterium simulans]|uniref:Uncharacterized protein n=1 Tax=Mycobacterium simulans TaxID=627089 RepID=A0A7Z7IMU3_9MYCO|nr:hypothetical protein MSIMFB_02750 [Mycobacterium simulans]
MDAKRGAAHAAFVRFVTFVRRDSGYTEQKYVSPRDRDLEKRYLTVSVMPLNTPFPDGSSITGTLCNQEMGAASRGGPSSRYSGALLRYGL